MRKWSHLGVLCGKSCSQAQILNSGVSDVPLTPVGWQNLLPALCLCAGCEGGGPAGEFMELEGSCSEKSAPRAWGLVSVQQV